MIFILLMKVLEQKFHIVELDTCAGAVGYQAFKQRGPINTTTIGRDMGSVSHPFLRESIAHGCKHEITKPLAYDIPSHFNVVRETICIAWCLPSVIRASHIDGTQEISVLDERQDSIGPC